MRKITLIAKRLYRAVFSRLVLTGLLLLSQVIWIAFLFFRLTDYAPWINGICIGAFDRTRVREELRLPYGDGQELFR